MKRLVLAAVATVVVLGIALAAVWTVARDGDEPSTGERRTCQSLSDVAMTVQASGDVSEGYWREVTSYVRATAKAANRSQNNRLQWEAWRLWGAWERVIGRLENDGGIPDRAWDRYDDAFEAMREACIDLGFQDGRGGVVPHNPDL